MKRHIALAISMIYCVAIGGSAFARSIETLEDYPAKQVELLAMIDKLSKEHKSSLWQVNLATKMDALNQLYDRAKNQPAFSQERENATQKLKYDADRFEKQLKIATAAVQKHTVDGEDSDLLATWG